MSSSWFCHSCSSPVRVHMHTGSPICIACGSDFVEERELEEALEEAPVDLFSFMGNILQMAQAHHESPEDRVFQTPFGQATFITGGNPLQTMMIETMLRQIQGMVPMENVGDYVTSQRALDEIITQLMEQHQAQNRPPPASASVIESLPRKTIDKAGLECSVCQEEYALGDQVIDLPCHHMFHPDCILSWLKLNGTCPVCRYSLVEESPSQ